MSMNRQILAAARAALETNGMGAEGWAELVACMAKGFRPILAREREDGSLDQDIPESARRKPLRILRLENGQEVILVDARTQEKALALIAEVQGIVRRGQQININTAEGGNAGDVAIENRAGNYVVLMDGAVNQDLAEAVRRLPEASRRLLAQAGVKELEAAVLKKRVESVDNAAD